MSDPGRASESDVDRDEGQALARAAGGVPQEGTPDQNSTTGTTPNKEFVGRIGGSDAGYAGETGAEARAAAAESGPG